MNKTLSLVCTISLVLITACGQTPPGSPSFATSTPAKEITTTLSPTSASTETNIPLETPTRNPSIQENPFPTETPNATARAVAEKWNSVSALLSPDGQWAALDSQPGVLRIVQIDGDKEYPIPCDTFSRCEFVDALQWSLDSSKLYFAPLLTGESNIPFDLYTGIARINVNTGKVDKLVEDSLSDMEYAFSLSPNGKYLAYTDMKESQPEFTLIETDPLQKVFNQVIDHGSATGNLIWTPGSQGVAFVSITNCESSVYFYDLKKEILSTLLTDPACIELLSVNENDLVALSKYSDQPLTKTYWNLDPYTKTLIPVLPRPE